MDVLLRRSLLLLVCLGLAVLGLSSAAQAASFTVNDTTDAPLATSSSNTCVSSHNGTCTLRAAVQAADNTGGSNSITLPAGGYKLTIPAAGPNTTADPATGDLDITGTDRLTISGAGSGSTTIDANHIDRAFAAQKGTALTLSGMTIKNGTPSSSSTGFQSGGAIYSDGALTLTGDMTFEQNSVINAQSGGAIYDDNDASASISGATFKNNNAGGGGAIAEEENGGTSSIRQSTFSGNVASNGGAIYMSQSAPATISDSTFTSNGFTSGSGGSGGAIITEFGNVTISTSTFSSNDVGTNGDGGAIYDDIDAGFTLTLNNNSFEANSANTGGGLYYQFASIAASGNTFSGNSASGSGGGIYQLANNVSGATATLVNNTFDGNSAPNGGGLEDTGNVVTTFVNNTVARNRGSAGRGGGIASPGAGAAGSKTANNIVANNIGGDCTTGTNGTALTAGQDPGNNLDSDSSCFAGPLNAGDKPGVDPKLGPLADNGGPTQTDALLAGSPAIDAGNDSQCPATDQRGVSRPQGPHCDIGAFEAAPARLSLSKSGPSSATSGIPFNYTVTVSNGGPSASTGTTVTDQLPANSVLYGVNSSQGNCAASGSPVTLNCNLGTLHAGGTATLTIVVAISKPGTVTNTATATNDQGSSSSGSATTTVNPAPTPSKASKPSAKTGRSHVAGKHKVRVFGQVTSGGQPTVYFVQYGRNRGYGLITRLRRIGGGSVNVRELLARLQRGVRYHYRVVAINNSGIFYGNDRTFRIRKHKKK